MDVVRLVEEKVLSVTEKVLKVLEGEIGYQEFEMVLKEELDGLGCELLKVVLEGLDDELLKSADRKKDWVVVRRSDLKAALTPFGVLKYKRTYFRNKEDKVYSYLVDQKAGIRAHSRVD